MNTAMNVKETINSSGIAAETKEQRQAKLKQACSDLESVFISTLMKAMRQTVPKSGLTTPEAGSDVYRSMSDQQLAIFLSKNQGLGLARQIYDQMCRRDQSLDSPSDPQNDEAAEAEAESPSGPLSTLSDAYLAGSPNRIAAQSPLREEK